MKLPLLALALCGALTPVLAAPAPKLAPQTACAPDANVDLTEAFLRLPAYVFRYFAVSDPASLLDAKGIVRDPKNGYIEIPYGGNSNHPDRDKVLRWQLKLFKDSRGRPVAVVNSMIYGQTKVLPFLHVFRFKNGYPYRTTAQDFPYPVGYFRAEGQKRPYTFVLERAGSTIYSGPPESDVGGPAYRWTGQRYVRFTPKNEPND